CGYAARELRATINWGDTTSSAGTIVSTGNGTFVVLGSHTYAELGGPGPDLENEQDAVDTFTITVTITDDTTVKVTDTANVAEEAEVLTAQGGFVFNTREFQPLNNITVATFTTEPGEMASEFKVTIDWGDGTSSAGTVVDLGNGNFTVVLRHTLAMLGGPGPDLENEQDAVDTFTITVTI